VTSGQAWPRAKPGLGRKPPDASVGIGHTMSPAACPFTSVIAQTGMRAAAQQRLQTIVLPR
jgi:hypothetical protein